MREVNESLPERGAASGQPDPELSVVVVTWNCRELSLRCLRTVLPMLAGISHEVFVVDNASEDGTAAAVAEAFAGVTVIRNTVNAGYAAANNLALARASGRFWLLLNPDAFPSGAAVIRRLLDCLAAEPRAAAAAPRLRRADGTHQVGDAGWAPNAATLAVHAFSLMRVSPRLRGVFLTGMPRQTVCDVDWLCGACLLVRADAARQAGLLDEAYFLYGEDIEWGCRLRDHGWRMLYLAEVEALHLGGGTQPGGVSTAWLDGLGQVYRGRNGAGGAAAFRLMVVLGFGLRAVSYAALSLWPGRGGLLRRAQAMAAYAGHGLRAQPGRGRGRPR